MTCIFLNPFSSALAHSDIMTGASYGKAISMELCFLIMTSTEGCRTKMLCLFKYCQQFHMD